MWQCLRDLVLFYVLDVQGGVDGLLRDVLGQSEKEVQDDELVAAVLGAVG